MSTTEFLKTHPIIYAIIGLLVLIVIGLLIYFIYIKSNTSSCTNNKCGSDDGSKDTSSICTTGNCVPSGENPINLTGKSPYSGLVCFDEDGTWAQHSNDDPDGDLQKQNKIKQSTIIEYLVQNDKLQDTGKNYVVGIISASGSADNIYIDKIDEKGNHRGVAHGDYLMIAQMNAMNKLTNNAIGSSIINGIQMTKDDVSKIFTDYANKCKSSIANKTGYKKCDILVQNIDTLLSNRIDVGKTGILVDNDSTVCNDFDERAKLWKVLGYTLYSVNLGTITNSSDNRPRIQSCLTCKNNKVTNIPFCQNKNNPPCTCDLCLVNIKNYIPKSSTPIP